MPLAIFATAISIPTFCAAQAEEWTCPAVDKVGVMATSPGWISYDSLMYPYQAPTLRFDSMENSTHGPAAICKYRVDKGGLLSMWKLAKCEPGKGNWQPGGPKATCEGTHPGQCSLVCSPVAGSARPGG
ncbi:MAG: hypothetical protein V4792_15060 [Pseudomonadota bacterium]